MVQRLGGQQSPAGRGAPALVATTDGVPLFVEELTKDGLSRGWSKSGRGAMS